MKKLILCTVTMLISAWAASPALAVFDSYAGDSSIYGVENSTMPNVLLVIDNSGSMSDTVVASDYDPATTYSTYNVCTNSPVSTSTACNSNYVYQMTSSSSYRLVYNYTSTNTPTYDCIRYRHDGTCRTWAWVDHYTYTYYPLKVSQVPTTCGTPDDPHDYLANDGIYTGFQLSPQASSTATATCTDSGSAGYTYVTGNYVNFTKSPSTTYSPKITVAVNVVKSLVKTTTGVNFGLMTYFQKPSCGTGVSCYDGGTFISKSNPVGTSSGTYVTTVKDMNAAYPSVGFGNASCINTSQCTNRDALRAAVGSLSANGYTPLGETLLEAGRYYNVENTTGGGVPAFGATTGVTSSHYTSPVISSCQRNFVIFVTDGMSTADNNAALETIGTDGDTDGDGNEPSDLSHSLDDVAKYLNTSTKNIISYFIGFNLSGANQDAIDLLTRAADQNHGKGKYFSANSQIELSNILSQIMTEIYTVNSSFVAPVVPVSPQNRTYGSSRVYMGFFRPSVNTYWSGNLKKYGLDSNNYVIDQNGNFATWVDENSDGLDDRDGVALELGASNGSFKSTAKSYWSDNVDAGTVKLGGVGEELKSQIGSRNLYTYNGSNTTLTDSTNLLSAVAYGTFGVADTTAKTSLINFLQGRDAYNEDSDSDTSEARNWIMGDILHSRPLVINYKKYTFNATTEADSSQNKSMIFAGGNDGMLHAINDYDGSEAWAFVPPDTLGKLKDITGIYHPIFSDSSVAAYVYDKNNNGTIEAADDKVILLFAERRGGGNHNSPTNGYYYALDVSDPATPKYLWSISNLTSGFSELAESWSEPKIVKMKIGSATKIVAFFGAGYDNPNEDGRYGATQGFTGTGSVADTDTGSGSVTSTPSVSASNPKGRGVYAVELATLNSSGVPSFTNSGTKLWSAVYGTGTPTAPDSYYSNMTFSFPSEISSIDSGNDGYTDRLYAVDTGGNLWRFDVGDASVANWTATKIFSSNPGDGGSTDVGRKVFYKPSVVSELGYKFVYFGTGDREHPLNTALTDRIYAFKDPDNNTFTTAKTESDLVDVTTDLLQDTTTTGTALQTQISNIFSQLNSSSKYGWYIKLNENSGEKVLAAPTVFNRVLYVTTYAPTTTTSTTACTGNLGTARIYAMDYKTGEAVFNYDTGNGNNYATSNLRAVDSSGHTLTRSDRVTTIGSGIPSGVVALISAGGQTSVMAGVGGKIATTQTKPGGTIIPLYWRQK